MNPSLPLQTHLSMLPSPLRPDCKAEDRLFEWKGVNPPPPGSFVSQHPWIRKIKQTAYRASVSDHAADYGEALRKFHIFCDIFSIPECDRLPASFVVLDSFVVWATADESSTPSPLLPTEPVSVSTARDYLAAVEAWHIIQGWDLPLTKMDREQIDFSLRDVAKLQADRREKPIRPPVNDDLTSS